MSKWTICWILTTKMGKAEGIFWNFNSYSMLFRMTGDQEIGDVGLNIEWVTRSETAATIRSIGIWTISNEKSPTQRGTQITRITRSTSLSRMIFNRPGFTDSLNSLRSWQETIWMCAMVALWPVWIGFGAWSLMRCWTLGQKSLGSLGHGWQHCNW